MKIAIGSGTLVVAWLLLAAVRAEPRPEPRDEEAEALVDGWIEALGGRETYWKLRSASYTLTTELYDPESGRLRRARPRYVTLARLEAGEAARIERWEGDDFIQHGFDGVQEWAVMNGETLGPGDKDYDEARYVSGDVFYWISLPFKLMDPGVFLHYDGTDAEGRHLVRVTFGEGVGDHSDTWFYTFEEGRAMPVSIGYREEGRQNISRTYWEDVQEVDGYVFTGRRVHINADGKVWKILVTKDFVLNPELDPAIFSGPWQPVDESPRAPKAAKHRTGSTGTGAGGHSLSTGPGGAHLVPTLGRRSSRTGMLRPVTVRASPSLGGHVPRSWPAPPLRRR